MPLQMSTSIDSERSAMAVASSVRKVCEGKRVAICSTTTFEKSESITCLKPPFCARLTPSSDEPHPICMIRVLARSAPASLCMTYSSATLRLTYLVVGVVVGVGVGGRRWRCGGLAKVVKTAAAMLVAVAILAAVG